MNNDEINFALASTDTTEGNTMTNVTSVVSGDVLDSIIELSSFRRQNIMERMIQQFLREAASAEVFRDKIELGDGTVHDLRGERPAPDTPAQAGKILSEKQHDLVEQINLDIDGLLTAAADMADLYRVHVDADQKPAYAVEETKVGWAPVRDARKALNLYYRQAVQRELERAAEAEAKRQRDEAGGARTVAADARKRRESHLDRL